MAATSDTRWSLAMGFFSGPAHAELARENLSKIARETGRSDLRVRSHERGSVVLAGYYDGPGDPNALAELERLKSIRVGNAQPYQRTYLTPPFVDRDHSRTADEMDLTGAKARFGDDKAIYTLQYASFDEGGPARYRRAAEEEASRLRAKGELAFYYHGRSNSTVTLGIFGDDALDANARFSPEVDALQRRYTFLMMNDERVPLGDGTYWPTRLVRVPD